MEIYKATGELTFPYAGDLAWPWGDCSSLTATPQETYQKVVVPWALEWASRHKNDIHIVERPVPLNYGITVILDEDSESYKVTKSSYELKSTSKGRYKDFEKAKEDNKIVLKPMKKFKMTAVAHPNLYPASVQRLSGRLLRYDYMEPGFGRPGVCRENRNRHPGLEVDVFASNCAWECDHMRGVVATPVDKSVLDSIMLDIDMFASRSLVDSKLVTKVVAEANSATFDIATEIGEMPETVKMILDGVKGGIKLLLRAKKDIKQNLSTGSVAKDAASQWMMYRYGLMPIVYSINDGLDLLEMSNRKFQSFRGRVDFPFEKFSARGYKCVSAPSIEDRCFLKYGYDLESSVHQGLKINLVATAWELIPLSFVWDWFFSIGDYLTAFFTPGVVNQIGCMYSHKIDGTFVFENETNSVISIDVKYYNAYIINPDSFIGINSDVFVSFKRSMDALALMWLIFKKDAK